MVDDEISIENLEDYFKVPLDKLIFEENGEIDDKKNN